MASGSGSSGNDASSHDNANRIAGAVADAVRRSLSGELSSPPGTPPPCMVSCNVRSSVEYLFLLLVNYWSHSKGGIKIPHSDFWGNPPPP